MSTLCTRPCRYMNISWRSPERATISVGVGTRTSVRYLLAKSEEVILGPRVCSLGGICLFISATSIHGTHFSFARSDPIFATAFSTVSCGTGGPHSIVLRRRHVFFFFYKLEVPDVSCAEFPDSICSLRDCGLTFAILTRFRTFSLLLL